MNLTTELASILNVLEENGVEYALCGGIALAIHGFPRFTKDIDLLIRDADLNKVKELVDPIGYRLQTGLFTFGPETSEEQKLCRIVKTEGNEHLLLDLLLVTPFLETVWKERVEADLGDRKIFVVSVAGLIQMKQSTGRTQDQADIEKLRGANDD